MVCSDRAAPHLRWGLSNGLRLLLRKQVGDSHITVNIAHCRLVRLGWHVEQDGVHQEHIGFD
eukprot:5352467-Amphidinium_carterae.1